MTVARTYVCIVECCKRCDKSKRYLVKCEGCGEDVCPECCVEMTYHNMIDFPFCKTCQELSEY